MPDREKVIQRLNHLERYGAFSEDWKQALRDAIALLREQEKPDCEHAEYDGVGCLGYAKSPWDDEPIDVCKICRKYTGNRYWEVSGDAAD